MLTTFLLDSAIQHVAPNDGATTTYTLAAGTTDVNSVAVDLQGIGPVSLTFLAVFGTNVDTGTFTWKLQSSDDNSTWADVTNATQSFTDASANTANKMLGIGTTNPTKRYYRVAIDRGVANTVINALLAIMGQPRAKPYTQLTTAGQFIAAPVSVA